MINVFPQTFLQTPLEVSILLCDRDLAHGANR